MITLLVGQRGVGKSQLIQRMKSYFAEEGTEFYDLDQEIETKLGRSIRDLFFDHGEDYFRGIERQVFSEIIQRRHKRTFLCLGAGFDLKVIPPQMDVWWIRRETDLDGRIFLNRPRLNPDLSPLEESIKRNSDRHQMYAKHSTWTYTMPEGLFSDKIRACEVEERILNNKLIQIDGFLTVLPEYLKNDLTWSSFCQRFLNKNIHFEIRNDLLNQEQVQKVCNALKNEKTVYSFRKSFLFEEIPACDYYDWPLENESTQDFLGKIPFAKRIISFHPNNLSVTQALAKINEYQEKAPYLKLSPLCENMLALKQYHQWQTKNPKQCSLLPRSKRGQWAWYRLLMKQKQFIQFWSEGEGSSLDQPSLFQWLATISPAQKFAAVIGNPVYHSYTPVEHYDFFLKKQVPVFAIQVDKTDFRESIDFLNELGLSYAAVTSPLKELAAELVGSSESSINTLIYLKQKWHGTTTDEVGVQALCEGIGMLAPLQKQISVWGGGGMLPILKKCLPLARFYEARTGRLRSEDAGSDENVSPRVVVWSAPRTPETQMPPSDWRPQMILDLNYKDDSMGKEYAQNCDCNYTSGHVLFLAQAQQQRVYWNKMETTNECK